MPNYMPAEGGSASGGKKIITITIIVLVALALAYFLFKISPEKPPVSSQGYNANLSTANVKPLSAVPAFDAAADRYQGNKNAKNIFIEYADYQCPACAAASTMLKDVPQKFPDTVFVYRYFPLVQIHQNALEAAMAAEAAGNQGKYWEMHDLLFQKQSDWETLTDPLDVFSQYAQSAGVKDLEQFKNDITAKKYLSVIQKNNDEALGLTLQGTPTYFFNGHQLQNSDFAGLLKQAGQWVSK